MDADLDLGSDPRWSERESVLRSIVSPNEVVKRLYDEILSRRGMTIDQLARSLEVDHGTAERLVDSEDARLPNIELLALLHYELGINLNHILAGTPPEQRVLPTGADLEEAVRAFVAKTIAGKHDLSHEYVVGELKRSGDLLPTLLDEGERRLRR